MLTNLVAATAASFLFLSGTAYADSGAADKDCGDFQYREDAQEYFDQQGYSAGNDPEELDDKGEGDGKACEKRPPRPDEDEDGGGDDSDEGSDSDSDKVSRDEGDNEDSEDEDSDGDEDKPTSQVTTVPRGSVEAGG